MSGCTVHQPKHFLDSGGAINVNRSCQEIAHERIERGVMAFRVGTSRRERFFVKGESDILPLHIICVRLLRVSRRGRSTGERLAQRAAAGSRGGERVVIDVTLNWIEEVRAQLEGIKK